MGMVNRETSARLPCPGGCGAGWMALCLLLLAPLLTMAEELEYYLAGNAADAAGDPQPGLFLQGGGRDVDRAVAWFLERAGGGDVVVLRASGGDGYNPYFYAEIGGVDSVETYIFHAREQAFLPHVAEALAHAEAIFIAGGDQSRYVRYWRDTPVQTLLNAHVAAGKPLGGTSAGLAVMGEFAYAALNVSTQPEVALADPYDPSITITRNFLTLPGLAGIFTDSHFTERARLGRLLVFLARVQDEHRPERLLGIGIDEQTALVVDGTGKAQVLSDKPEGRVWLVAPTEPAGLASGNPLRWERVRVVGLGDGETVSLAPGAELPFDKTLRVRDGVITWD